MTAILFSVISQQLCYELGCTTVDSFIITFPSLPDKLNNL